MMKKSLLSGVVAVCFWLALNTAHYAQTGTPEFDPLGEFNELPKQIRVQVEYVDVSHEQLTDLMFGAKAATNDVELRKQVTQLVKDGKATIVETMLCMARSGEKATSESVEEFIYPTEYGPIDLPWDNPIVNGPLTSRVPTNPMLRLLTAFETRNTGVTAEVEPTKSHDDRFIDLRIAPQVVTPLRLETWMEHKDQWGDASVRMPVYETWRSNGSLAVKP